MVERYPGYDVLKKYDGPSWNDKTRAVIDDRLALKPFSCENLSSVQFDALTAICDRIIPQNARRPRPVPLASFIDQKLIPGASEGFRDSRMPPLTEAWTQGLDAIDDESKGRYGCPFYKLETGLQDELLNSICSGDTLSAMWKDLPPALFFSKRLLHDIVSAYYAFPESWNEIGFGGPAGPRGYVRLGFDKRDPWEASEDRDGRTEKAKAENANVR